MAVLVTWADGHRTIQEPFSEGSAEIYHIELSPSKWVPPLPEELRERIKKRELQQDNPRREPDV